MKLLNSLLLVLLFSAFTYAQNGGTLKGNIIDSKTGETIIGAYVIANADNGTVTDIDGNYTLPLAAGEYEIKVSFIGYETLMEPIRI